MFPSGFCKSSQSRAKLSERKPEMSEELQDERRDEPGLCEDRLTEELVLEDTPVGCGFGKRSLNHFSTPGFGARLDGFRV